MTKAELIQELAHRTGIHRNLAEHLHDNLMDIIAEQLCALDRVPIGHLGHLKAAISAPHEGRNPKTKEPIFIPAHAKLRLHTAKTFQLRMEREILSARALQS
ncbi:MAG: HU family DNA-binding protein [Acidithiobacillus sp.]|nr:HU family DNA-binding protein [Acidithiobacillus sp.]